MLRKLDRELGNRDDTIAELKQKCDRLEKELDKAKKTNR
jgi:septal ring factor EnvC (AmiA/AmiB activator)